jgi:hypothetical protein
MTEEGLRERQWTLGVRRLPRYQLPLIRVLLNGWLVVDRALSTAEPITSIALKVAEDLQRTRPMPGGRIIIPSDSGRVIARTIRLPSLRIPTLSGGPIDLAPWRVAVAVRPQSLGVGGLLGTDFLARFTRIAFEAGPPDRLRLEAAG